MHMWQFIQAITNYRTTSAAFDNYVSLPDGLNNFYVRFKRQKNVVTRKTTPPPDDQVLCLTTADVRNTLRRADLNKAAGAGNVRGHVLREYADANKYFQSPPEQCRCPKVHQVHHNCPHLPTALDPQQFAYHPNRSTDDAIASILHLALTHRDRTFKQIN